MKEKIAYVFTNGMYAQLVVLFNGKFEDFYIEELSERVLNEVLLPKKMTKFYATQEQLEKNGCPLDEDGYFQEMISVFGNDGNEYFFDDEKLIIKNATKQDLASWNSLYWCEIIELD